tara:strand:+ start:541 stop:690 length:150 start_codon:yes stop_codon:yes gene_type:complete
MINTERFFNLLADSNLEYDLQKQFIELANEINNLSEETDAKRYAILGTE